MTHGQGTKTGQGRSTCTAALTTSYMPSLDLILYLNAYLLYVKDFDAFEVRIEKTIMRISPSRQYFSFSHDSRNV